MRHRLLLLPFVVANACSTATRTAVSDPAASPATDVDDALWIADGDKAHSCFQRLRRL